MSIYEEIVIGPDMSQEFQSFEEFCLENSGHELTYLGVVSANPLEMDPVTLAFSMRHLVRLSRPLLDMLLDSLKNEVTPSTDQVLEAKGIQLDKTQAEKLRHIVFAFRDSDSEETQSNFVKGLQLMAMSRERKKISLNLGESYTPPDESWTEDELSDDVSYETVRAVENPRWKDTEEYE